jgi:acyl transferase domain-containing protein
MGVQGGLAGDGRCKSFSQAADGAGFSEGVGMLVLERLSEAKRNGHPIQAILRGSAVNQDGASNGLTAPNGPSQERVIAQALANAGLTPKDVDAVEAHGTGTVLGDPIEAGALLATYGSERRNGPLRLGSIKSNIGHTQAAAGVAGVIKMVMALREGLLPKTLHVDAPSSHVEWEMGEVELLTEATPWAPNGQPRRAGVSSFGISGTNAHVIVEEAPSQDPGPEEAEPEGGAGPAEVALPSPTMVGLSAKTEPALKEVAGRLASQLEEEPELDPTDLAYSLATTRSAFSERAVILGSEREQILTSLAALADGKEAPGLIRGLAPSLQHPVFLFPGQGSQWQGMAAELAQASPVFAGFLSECEVALSPHLDFSLGEVLRDTEGAASIERIEVVQPALFAVMVSLAKLWRHFGVSPAAVVGHSQGEIAAAHIAGGLSLDQAARLAALRSQIIAGIAGKGALVSIAMGAKELDSLLARWEGAIEVAALNSPSSTVLSGDRKSLDQLLAHCESEGLRAREIPGTIASHSAYVEELRDQVLEAFADLSPQSGQIPLHSTVSGEVIDTATMDAEYWYSNLRQTVLFEPVTRGLLEAGHRVLIEVSPHPVFALALEETVESTLTDPNQASVLETLRREEGGPERFQLSLARAHTAGAALDWEALFKGKDPKRVPLPTYPFQRQRYWLGRNPEESDPRAIGQAPVLHPLLGAEIESPNDGSITTTGRLSLRSHPWLGDLIVGGVALFPGTGYIELGLHALSRTDATQISEMTLQAPMIIPEKGGVGLQMTITGLADDGTREMAIYSRPESTGHQRSSEWTCHATGRLGYEPVPVPEPLPDWPPSDTTALPPEDAYDLLAYFNGDFGSSYRTLDAAWRTGSTTYAELSLGEAQRGSAVDFCVHPVLLHGAFHSLMAGGDVGDLKGTVNSILTFSWSDISLYARGSADLRTRVHMSPDAKLSIDAFDQEGNPVVSIGSVTMRDISDEQYAAARRGGEMLLGLEWNEASLQKREHMTGIAVIGDVELPKASRYEDLDAIGEAIEKGDPAPSIVLCDAPMVEGADPAESARESAIATFRLVQTWLKEDRFGESRLVFLTRGAVACKEDESPDPAAAAIWGLLRSAQMERPGRFALLDLDSTEASLALVPSALATDDEPQLALREGAAFVPRATRIPMLVKDEDRSLVLDPNTTVLVTGGTGGLGSLTARHLVEEHGVRHLLLVSRSGADAEGAAELEAELSGFGAQVTITACDVSDRAALQSLLETLPADRPLGAVFHSAGAIADGTIDSLRPQDFDAVFAPKANAAWYLHELSKGADLQAFVVFSSLAGVLGAPGQGNYAAANVFIDTLVGRRRAEGLAGTSIAWGLWERASAMTGDLTEVDHKRVERIGIAAMSDEQGMALFDSAIASKRPFTMAFRGNLSGLRAIATAGFLPPVLRGVVRGDASRRPVGPILPDRIKGLSEKECREVALEMVRSEAAVVLGYSSAEDIAPQVNFMDMGFDSLGALELRNRLCIATGLNLTATAVFDHPNAEALSQALLVQLGGDGGEAFNGSDSESARVQI